MRKEGKRIGLCGYGRKRDGKELKFGFKSKSYVFSRNRKQPSMYFDELLYII